MFLSRLLVAMLATLLVAPVAAAADRDRAIDDPTAWGLVYAQSGIDRVTVERDLRYGPDPGQFFDRYEDDGTPAPKPAIVFVNGIGDLPDDPLRRWAIYESWARTVAARGYVGITHGCRAGAVSADLTALFGHLVQESEALGLDPARIGIFAASANVSAALPFAMAEPPEGLRAAVFYYGAGATMRIRRDLPVLHVLAERDQPQLLQSQRDMRERARAASAPWTCLDAPTLPHAFDGLDPSDASRQVIAQTLAFWDAHLLPLPPAPARSPVREAIALSYAQDWEAAADAWRQVLAKGNDEPETWAALGRAQQNARRTEEAESSFQRALARDPEQPTAVRQLAMLYQQTERCELAIPLLQRTVAARPHDFQVRNSLASCLHAKGDYAGAAAQLESALAMGFSHPIAWYNLACALALLGETDRALDALEQAIAGGFTDRGAISSDPDLISLREHERFRQMLARLGS